MKTNNTTLPQPPAIIIEQPDGTLKEFSKRDIIRTGYGIDKISVALCMHGFDYMSHQSDIRLLEQLCPEKFAKLVAAYEELYEAQTEIEGY